jgi:hypothetical protein
MEGPSVLRAFGLVGCARESGLPPSGEGDDGGDGDACGALHVPLKRTHDGWADAAIGEIDRQWPAPSRHGQFRSPVSLPLSLPSFPVAPRPG